MKNLPFLFVSSSTSTREVRFLGGLMAVFGVFNFLLISGISVLINQNIKQTGKFHPKSSYMTTPDEKAILSAVLGAFAILGISMLIVGGLQWKTGKRNRKLELTVFVMGFTLEILTVIFPIFL